MSFKSSMSMTPSCSLEEVLTRPLTGSSSGGVIASTMQGKIQVDNTLDERLGLLEHDVRVFFHGESSYIAELYGVQMLPEMRTDLFGKNPNRRFLAVSR